MMSGAVRCARYGRPCGSGSDQVPSFSLQLPFARTLFIQYASSISAFTGITSPYVPLRKVSNRAMRMSSTSPLALMSGS